MVEIVANENSFFKLQSNNPLSSLYWKRTIKKNEVCYRNVMLKNYKEQLPHNLKRWGAKNKLLKQITESPSMLHMFLLSPFSFNSTLTL